MYKDKDMANAFFGDLTPKQTEESHSEQMRKEISAIAQTAMSDLNDDALLALPTGFTSYFEKYLKNNNFDGKDQILELVNTSNVDGNRVIEFERSVKDGLKDIKNILEIVANMHKVLNLVYNTIEKKSIEINKIDNKLAFSSASKIFSQELKHLKGIIANQINQIGDAYNRTTQSISEISKNATYDASLDVYNKQYLLSTINKEIEISKNFKNNCVIMAFTFSEALMKSIKNKETLSALNKNLSKLLLKLTRRSDVVSYVDNFIFAACLKYINIEEAQTLAQHIIKVTSQNNVIVDDDELSMDIRIGIFAIDAMVDASTALQNAIKAVNIAKDENILVKVFPTF